MTTTRYHHTAPSIAEAFAGRKTGKMRRTNQPVRRHSYHRGEREARFWRRVDPLEHRAIYEAACRHDLATKEAGKRNGALGHVALQVLKFLMEDVDWKDGCLEPAIAYIMARIRRSRDAVVRALAALKNAGFLEWMRRSEPVEDAEGAGPRVRQISNAYRILVPASWRQRVAMRLAQWKAANDKAAGRGRTASAERPAKPIDPELEAMLARLGEGVARKDASPPSGQNPVPGSQG